MHPSSYRRARPGFTLTELLIVVMIAVILLAVALPTVKYSIEEGKLREASRQINAFFAQAKAGAAATGRPRGVWFALEKVGDPNGVTYACTQLYLAEVPEPYCGDVLNAKAIIGYADPSNQFVLGIPAIGSANQLDPWLLAFPASPGAYGLFKVGESFAIRFDYKGDVFYGETFNRPSFDDDRDGQADETGEFGLWLYGRGGAPLNNAKYGKPNVDDNGNGIVDQDMNGPDIGEYGASGSDDVVYFPPSANGSGGYSFQLYRGPQRIGSPLSLPRGVAIDIDHSGGGATDRFIDREYPSPPNSSFNRPAEVILVMFSPTGGVQNVSLMQASGTAISDAGFTTLHFLIGRPEKIGAQQNYTDFNRLADTNLADGTCLWVSISRRTGSVITTDNAPSFNPNDYSPAQPFPPTTQQQMKNFVERAREFATGGESKGGQ